MPQSTITAWREESELLAIRNIFFRTQARKEGYGDWEFPEDETQAIRNLRKLAVNKVISQWSWFGGSADLLTCQVFVWTQNGQLPHSIEATALLVDAILLDQDSDVSPFAVQATYSAAFCRFVTGLTDIEQNDKLYKRTMFDIARTLKLPDSFVELRHQATHGELPSLTVMREAVKQSMDWLWENYWRDLSVRTGMFYNENNEPSGDGVLPLEENLRQVLRAYKKVRIRVVKNSTSSPKKVNISQTVTPTSTSHRISKLLKNHAEPTKVLVKVLLEESFLIPSNKALGTSMNGAFVLWDELLKSLFLTQRYLLRLLLNEMCIVIASPSSLDLKLDPYREAVYIWLERILTSTSTLNKWPQRRVQLNSIMSTCMMNQNYWTLQLGLTLVRHSRDARFKARWEALVKLCTEESENEEDVVMENTADCPSPDDELDSDCNDSLDIDSILSKQLGGGTVRSYRWKEASNWIPKPIGLV
ncbi:MAG: rRNA-processing protein las1 [Cirrosporium novae-zelandiae]|nr:MAG: rRNA-processing protein las1 [Cirrosporium novae-zelandiae]